jgi:hypothetical protein
VSATAPNPRDPSGLILLALIWLVCVALLLVALLRGAESCG